jgi:hypothetical protein
MTLRLIPSIGASEVWYAQSGDINIGSLTRAGARQERWHWSITRLYEPGWQLSGGEESRDAAMSAMGSQFRRWLAHAGLEETDDQTPRVGPPFIWEGDKARKRLLTPAGLHVGCAEFVYFPARLTADPGVHLWTAWLTKFVDRFPGSGSRGETIEEALAGVAAGFRAYIARAGLREICNGV